MSKLDEDKGIVYGNRVLIGNWYESAKLEEYKLNKFLEQMKKGDLMLARYRKMSENLNKPTVLTQSSSSIGFGAKIAFLAPHVPATDPPTENKKGLLLGGHISSNEINYSQELEDGCNIVGLSDLQPTEKNTFILTSADYCNREGEPLKFNQEFLLALASSVEKKKVNTDIIINHCATNANLGINIGCWAMGFYGKVCAPLMKTCLDVYGKELPNNIWQIYIPLTG
ncbi:cilia- and flagella-associated protein 161-like isoform X3 [Maniola jurtina]|uniref:cilia- and flagella-associated protein 161-like isoform X3 n=1 Tax=Maniola jurtina TaxID=191418 RepID=UPI001E68DD1D|nr:cilia- and flagella-associated protein 161-like isoform X3 [Maniola jurtina]